MRLNLFILLLVSVLVGQAQRQLEFVNARATENKPYFQYANSLPKIVLEGVMSGGVKHRL